MNQADPISVSTTALSSTLPHHGVATVTLRNVLDSKGADALDRAVASLVNKGCAAIAVDVEHLDRMTTAGAGALIKIAADLRAAGRDLVMVCPNAQVFGLLQILGLEREIRIFADKGSAEAALRSKTPVGLTPEIR